MHNVFHVSMLHKYVPDLGLIIDYQTLEVAEDASYKEVLICILDRKEKSIKDPIHSVCQGAMAIP